MIKRKVYIHQHLENPSAECENQKDVDQQNTSSEILIYCLKDLNKPIVKIKEKKFKNVQIGFFIEQERETVFSLLGDNYKYLIHAKPGQTIDSFSDVIEGSLGTTN